MPSLQAMMHFMVKTGAERCTMKSVLETGEFIDFMIDHELMDLTE